jgi:hypothetical protein
MRSGCLACQEVAHEQDRRYRPHNTERRVEALMALFPSSETNGDGTRCLGKLRRSIALIAETPAYTCLGILMNSGAAWNIPASTGISEAPNRPSSRRWSGSPAN